MTPRATKAAHVMSDLLGPYPYDERPLGNEYCMAILRVAINEAYDLHLMPNHPDNRDLMVILMQIMEGKDE